MKKILLAVIVLMFSMTGAEAVMMNYNNGYGYHGYGGRNYNYSNPNNYGSNAAFTPQNIQRATDEARRIEYENKYLDALKNSQNINVNVNHTGNPVRTYYSNPYNRYNNSYYNYNRYYNNGYYNNSGYRYPSGGRVYYNQGNGISIPGVRIF